VEAAMSIEFAVERLYNTGWLPMVDDDLDQLETGASFPTIAAIKQFFSDGGMSLTIRHHIMFNCYHASWEPKAAKTVGTLANESSASSNMRGTVVGACEREAAVYALAQFLESTSLQSSVLNA
jgi:hypothetical protein